MEFGRTPALVILLFVPYPNEKCVTDSGYYSVVPKPRRPYKHVLIPYYPILPAR